MEEKFICIHGHFYQPPRENAWLEAVEVQDSAHPYHDWNRRITAECYAANAFSRILDDEGRIQRIVNNYEKISFNFGPTLLAWMEKEAPSTYEAIREADKNSVQRFSGHGSAMAQAYNHMILPLAGKRDKRTQVLWGIRDFIHRFGRDPEGMWLPETAVDLESLEVMAEAGIRFTILSPHQAGRVRAEDEEKWRDVSNGSIDPKEAYLQRLPGGKSIAVFFYDGPISRAVAFENLLTDGESFASRLNEGFDDRDGPQLLHIATDGESYGHHSRRGDMALAFALHFIEAEGLARLTNYGAYLAEHPPRSEVDILEDTSWSCAHGVERWRTDCGCHSGGRPGWHQRWRAPLRRALDRLSEEVADDWESKIGEHLKHPWHARDEYIEVVLDRSEDSVEKYIRRHARGARSPADNVRILRLMEMQRHAMLMFTSCGWFFDEISGIETVQVLQYAGRLLQLHEDIFGGDAESRFLAALEEAESNLPSHESGRDVYESLVRPAMLDLSRVAAHYAISTLFEALPEGFELFCYAVNRQEEMRDEAGRARLSLGRAEISSRITQESGTFQYGTLYMGDHQLICGLTMEPASDRFHAMAGQVFEAFEQADFGGIVQTLGDHFSGSIHSLTSLFKDAQREVIHRILERPIADALDVYRHVYEPNIPLLRFLKNSATPTPPALHTAGHFVLNAALKAEFGRKTLDFEAIADWLRQADLGGIELAAGSLEYTLRKNLEAQAVRLSEDPDRTDVLDRLTRGVDLAVTLPFEVNLREVQNLSYELSRSAYPDRRGRTSQESGDAHRWVEAFESLCSRLNLRLPENG